MRGASVLNLAAQYHVDPAHTEHVARLALGLFDELAAAELHPGDPVERELLWAACVLHDIGMSVDYDDHHKHSRYLILNAGLPGLLPARGRGDRAGRALSPQGQCPTPGPLAALFGKRDAAQLDRCAVLLRLAEDLERSRDQVVRQAHVTVKDSEVELRLIAEGEILVPQWAAARETEVFAKAFQRRLTVTS